MTDVRHQPTQSHLSVPYLRFLDRKPSSPPIFPYSWYPDPAPSNSQDTDVNTISWKGDHQKNPIQPAGQDGSSFHGTRRGWENWWPIIILSPPDFRPLLRISTWIILHGYLHYVFLTPPSNSSTPARHPTLSTWRRHLIPQVKSSVPLWMPIISPGCDLCF